MQVMLTRWTKSAVCILIGALLVACSPEESSSSNSASNPSSTLLANAPVTGTPVSAVSLSLIYTANLQGELEPCGCTPETDFGGILRHSTGLKQLRSQFPQAFVVAGGGVLETSTSTQTIKNQFILQGLQYLGYDAIGLQWRDVTFGDTPLAESQLPWVASNYPRDIFARQKLIDRDGNRLLVLSLLDDKQFALMTGRDRFDHLSKQILDQLREAHQQDYITLVILSPNMQEWLTQLQDHTDFILLPMAAEHFSEPRALSDKTWVLQPGHRGMHLGSASFQRSTEGKWSLIQQQVLALSAQISNDVDLQPWYDQYNEALRQDYQREVALKQQLKQPSTYIGAASCQSCHAEIYAKWQTTAHAHALDKLKAVNKAFDPECLSCHVVGLEKGGFVDEVTTPQLANVQCESCHGPRRAHSENPVGSKSVAGLATAMPSEVLPAHVASPLPTDKLLSTQIACSSCHNSEHSPHFNFEKYWPHIQHP